MLEVLYTYSSPNSQTKYFIRWDKNILENKCICTDSYRSFLCFVYLYIPKQSTLEDELKKIMFCFVLKKPKNNQSGFIVIGFTITTDLTLTSVKERNGEKNDDQKLLKFPFLLTISLMAEVCKGRDEFIITWNFHVLLEVFNFSDNLKRFLTKCWKVHLKLSPIIVRFLRHHSFVMYGNVN